MTKRIKDNRYGKRNMLTNLFYVVPAIFLFGCGYIFVMKDQNLLFTLCIIGFVFCIGYGIIKDYKRKKAGYKCRKCNQTILEPIIKNRVGGDPIIYYCKSCDIEWDTMLREHDSV